MINILKSGVTGMTGQSLKVENIANNISNVNTPGFKNSQVNFSDLLYGEKAQKGIPVARERETGLLPQTGGGSRIAGISVNQAAGVLYDTGRMLDLAVEGEGFFSVELPDGSTAYTRDGAFSFNSEGQLVTVQGNLVSMDDSQPLPPGSKPETLSINSLGEVKVKAAVEVNTETEKRLLDLNVRGDGYLGLELPDGSTAYTRSKEVYLDGEGRLFTSEGNYRVKGEPGDMPRGSLWDTFKINYNGEMHVLNEEGEEINLGRLYLYSLENFEEQAFGQGNLILETDISGEVLQKYPQEDGLGALETVDIYYKDVSLGRLHLYNFENPSGLTSLGSNLFVPNEASGDASEGYPEEAALGSLRQGILEGSNVNLADEMSRLILSQRYFQLNSRSVRLADELWSLANNIRR